jgi:hypothetical protein
MREIECPDCDWLAPAERARVLRFLAAALSARGSHAVGELEVVKQSGISLLLRGQESSGAGFFLKAVPAAFRQEPPLTAALAARFSTSLPEVLAFDAECRLLLTRQVSGPSLREHGGHEAWLATAQTLARLQLGSTQRPDEWLACGCPERGVLALDDELQRILSDAVPLCAAIGSPIPDELVTRLRALRETLSSDARELASRQLPQTLVHGDFHGGNVIVTEAGTATVIDWSDGALAHPFFDPFILFHAEPRELESALRERMLDAYLSEWERAGFGTQPELRRTFALAQRLAPLYHAASYRRVIAIGPGAARDFARSFSWLLGLLSQAYG